MRTADTLPGESNAQIISSIINLVCPQCGGRMSEFQCEGRCRRKLACRMGMVKSGHQKPQIPASPRRPGDTVSYCTSVDSYLM
jgi:hypothetical protein